MSDINYDPETKIFFREGQAPQVPKGGLGQFMWNKMHEHKSKVSQIDSVTGQKEHYSTLLQKSIRLALNLRKLGIRKGDIISQCSYNCFHCSSYITSSIFIGAIICSTDPTISQDDNEFLMNLIKPKLIFVDEDSEKLMRSVFKAINYQPMFIVYGSKEFKDLLKPVEGEDTFKPDCNGNGNDTAIMFFSSGTTGMPKAICISHNLLLYNYQFFSKFHIPKVILSYTTSYWISSILLYLTSLEFGAARVFAKSFDAKNFWIIATKFDVDNVFMAPTFAISILHEKPKNLSTKIKLFLTGGTAISPDYLLKLREALAGAKFIIAYGQTESGVSVMFDPREDRYINELESCGRPITGFKLKVVDPNTEEAVGFNTEGELRIYSPYLMNGYYKQNAADCIDKNGFLKTGDIVTYNEDFCIFVRDRIKEMFKYKSWHIVPAKLEGILESHPAVKIAAVIGIPHPEDDHHATGVILKKDGVKVTAEEILKYFETKVDARNRLYGGIKFVNEMPLTPSGKIKRQDLKRMILGEIGCNKK